MCSDRDNAVHESVALAPSRRALLLAFGASATSLIASRQANAAWPEHIIRLIVPFGAGSSSDTIGRIIAAKLAEKLTQQIIVENRVGAATIVGTRAIAKAIPDGYTLGIANTSTHAASAAVHKELPFDPIKDFAPIGMIGSSPFLLIGSPQLPAKSLREFAALAKKQPGKLSYASAGTGTLTHLAGELVKLRLGINVNHVPYRGSEQSITDVLTGRIDLMIATIPPTLGHITNRELTPYAIMSAKRSTLMPEVPTVAEAGAPGCEAGLWTALVAPSGVPADIIHQLNQALQEVVGRSDVQDAFRVQGVTPDPSTPEATEQRIRDDIIRWKAVAAEANVHVDP